MQLTFPGESSEYRAARHRLLAQEADLRRKMEEVAAARRELPPGGRVPRDYVFQEAETDGASIDVRLSELFAPGKDGKIIYSQLSNPFLTIEEAIAGAIKLAPNPVPGLGAPFQHVPAKAPVAAARDSTMMVSNVLIGVASRPQQTRPNIRYGGCKSCPCRPPLL